MWQSIGKTLLFGIGAIVQLLEREHLQALTMNGQLLSI
jgi:hypothetical protein